LLVSEADILDGIVLGLVARAGRVDRP